MGGDTRSGGVGAGCRGGKEREIRYWKVCASKQSRKEKGQVGVFYSARFTSPS